MLLEITDIGGGIVEIVYNDASTILKRRLLRKSNFYDVQLEKNEAYIMLMGSDMIRMSYQYISRIGLINNPSSNQVVYDEFKTMMLV